MASREGRAMSVVGFKVALCFTCVIVKKVKTSFYETLPYQKGAIRVEHLMENLFVLLSVSG